MTQYTANFVRMGARISSARDQQQLIERIEVMRSMALNEPHPKAHVPDRRTKPSITLPRFKFMEKPDV